MRRTYRVQGAEVVQSVWIEVEKWTTGTHCFRDSGRLCRFQWAESLPKLGRDFAMAQEAESPEIVEIALAATFRYGKDVVGVP